MAAMPQRAQRGVLMKEVRQADIDNVAVHGFDGRLIIFKKGAVRKAITGGEVFCAGNILIHDRCDLRLLPDARIAVGVQIGGKGCADQDYFYFLHL